MKNPLKAIITLTLGVIASLGAHHTVSAQARDSQTQNFSLKEAIDYAIANNTTTKNTRLDITNAKARVGEITASGLPQINGNVQISHSPVVQPFVQENRLGSPFYTPTLPTGAAYPLALSLKNTGSASITLQQLLFDGQYIVGLQAAKVYTELSNKLNEGEEVNVIANVSKAYYGVLVNRERLGLLDLNINRLDSTLREARQLQKQGFVEKLDVNRLEVSYNNLKVEKQKAERGVDLTLQLLKFQLGLSQANNIELTDKLDDKDVKGATAIAPDQFDYAQRIEYRQLKTSRDLSDFDRRRYMAAYLPTLGISATLASTTGASNFANLTQFNDRWFGYGFIGGQLNVPIFDGFNKHYKIQQAKLATQKLDNNITQLKQSIDLQLAQSATTLNNAVQTLETQKLNLDLAGEVARVTRVKYKAGVGSNLELTTAESGLKEAQTNYYSALYDAVIAKIDLDKASGNLKAK